MQLADLAPVLVVLLAGFMRGVTGFGGAMVMAAPLSLLLDPVSAVVVTLALEAAAAFVMFPTALPQIRTRTLAFLTVPACFTVPIGGYLLLTLDAVVAQKLIAAVVVAFSLLLLSGFRYHGAPRPATSIALGGLVGVLLGATSVGAPPVILYLLSSSDPHHVTRANLTVFVTAISVIGLFMLAAAGEITLGLMFHAAVLSGPFMLATWAGGLLFERLKETSIRRVALAAMLAIGVLGLIA